MMYSIKIKNKELFELLEAQTPEFPKYVSQIINLANQNAQGTRPKVVGQMTELVAKSNSRSLNEWQEWYSINYPNSLHDATQRVWTMIKQLKDAIAKIDESMVKQWVEDLVIAKTYVGLKFHKAILKKVARHLSKDFRLSTPLEEGQGIDGWINEMPVSIKPDTYKIKMGLPENISVGMIYYSKKKDGISIEFDDAKILKTGQ
jgi:hypothetical protein